MTPYTWDNDFLDSVEYKAKEAVLKKMFDDADVEEEKRFQSPSLGQTGYFTSQPQTPSPTK